MRNKRKFKIELRETVDGKIYFAIKYPGFSTIEMISFLEIIKNEIIEKQITCDEK